MMEAESTSETWANFYQTTTQQPRRESHLDGNIGLLLRNIFPLLLKFVSIFFMSLHTQHVLSFLDTLKVRFYELVNESFRELHKRHFKIRNFKRINRCQTQYHESVGMLYEGVNSCLVTDWFCSGEKNSLASHRRRPSGSVLQRDAPGR
jgi:hypothetical protein